MACDRHASQRYDHLRCIEAAITEDGLFDDAVLARAAALGWAPRVPAEPARG